jgi:hypothetical protein
MPPRPPDKPDQGTKMPLPPGVLAEPTPVERATGIPLPDLLKPQTLGDMAKKAGAK